MWQKAPRSKYLGERTTAADFHHVFDQQMDRLYTLALLLTADHKAAEECFLASLADCVNSAPVFKQCALRWSRRVVIKNAIRMVGPTSTTHSAIDIGLAAERIEMPLARLLCRLDQFPRFVLVLSVLEQYGDTECARLLSCCPKDIVSARGMALRQLSNVAGPAPTETVAVFRPASDHTRFAPYLFDNIDLPAPLRFALGCTNAPSE